jgi:hypothetical protein
MSIQLWTDYVENSSLKSLPTSLYEREEKYFPLSKRGIEGDFHSSRVPSGHGTLVMELFC